MKNNRKGILDKFANPGKIQPISTADLHSGLPYQRPVRQRHVNKLVREWDPTYLTPIEVSLRDGKYNIVNGQHRVAAIRRIIPTVSSAALSPSTPGSPKTGLRWRTA